MDNYNRGNNGYGANVGSTNRDWQEYIRGQQERHRRLDQERQQRLNQDRQRQLSQYNSQQTVPGFTGNNNSVNIDGSSFKALSFIVAWLILFYLTYQVYVPLLEMVFGNDLKVSEAVKWLNVAIMMLPPTIIVYLLRRFIPALFAFSIIAGIIAVATL